MTCIRKTLILGEMIANESCGFLEVTLNDVALAQDEIYVTLNSSFFSMTDEVIKDGETKTYVDSGCKETWTVEVRGIFGTDAIIELCVVPEEVPPDVIPCADYTNEAACEAAGCYWYDGVCHGTADVPGPEEVIIIPGQPWVAPLQTFALHVEEIGGLPSIVNCKDNETIRVVVIGEKHLIDEVVDISWTRTGAAVGDVIMVGARFMYTPIDGAIKAKAEFDWTPTELNIGTGKFHATMAPTDQWTQGGTSNELSFEVVPSICNVFLQVEDQNGNLVGDIEINVGSQHVFTSPAGDASVLLDCGTEYSALALGNEEHRCIPSSECSKVFIAEEGFVVTLHITKTVAKGQIQGVTWEACHPYGGCSVDIAYWGSDVTLTVTSKNVGTATGYFKTRVTDRDTDVIMAETNFVSIAEGATWVDSPVFVMPSVESLRLRVELIRDD